eukprot:8396798-Pyramimonas_sp.AAC.1
MSSRAKGPRAEAPPTSPTSLGALDVCIVCTAIKIHIAKIVQRCAPSTQTPNPQKSAAEEGRRWIQTLKQRTQ